MVRYLEAIQSELTPDIMDHLNRPGINIWRGPGRAGKSCAMHWGAQTFHFTGDEKQLANGGGIV